MKNKRQTVFLSEGLVKMLDVIMKNTGSGSISKAIIFCVQDVYTKKYYNKYTMKNVAGLGSEEDETPKMTKEQICEYLGGTVLRQGGERICKLNKGAMRVTALVDMMGTGDFKATQENQEYYKTLEERKALLKEKEENGL